LSTRLLQNNSIYQEIIEFKDCAPMPEAQEAIAQEWQTMKGNKLPRLIVRMGRRYSEIFYFYVSLQTAELTGRLPEILCHPKHSDT